METGISASAVALELPSSARLRACDECLALGLPGDHAIQPTRSYTADQAAHVGWGGSRHVVYRMVRDGRLAARQHGRGASLRVTGRAILAALDGDGVLGVEHSTVDLLETIVATRSASDPERLVALRALREARRTINNLTAAKDDDASVGSRSPRLENSNRRREGRMRLDNVSRES